MRNKEYMSFVSLCQKENTLYVKKKNMFLMSLCQKENIFLMSKEKYPVFKSNYGFVS